MSAIETRICKLKIDEKLHSFEVKGSFFTEDKGTLFYPENNIIENTHWSDKGYTIIDTFTPEEFQDLKASIRKQVIIGLKKANIAINETTFELDKYHLYTNSDITHLKVINHTRNLRNEDFDIDFKLLEEKFSKAIQKKLSSTIKEIGRTHIQIRLNRPNSLDINPPHRDSYLSYYKHILNIWIPITGCNHNSSLPVIPKSHLLPERNIERTASKGATINGNTYFVPCIYKTDSDILKMTRPNPKEGQSLIFSPFLIHGAAFNNNKNTTRVSLELRFEQY